MMAHQRPATHAVAVSPPPPPPPNHGARDEAGRLLGHVRRRGCARAAMPGAAAVKYGLILPGGPKWAGGANASYDGSQTR